MSVEKFHTSLDEPAVVVVPERVRGVRIESQPDGFGMVWSTDLDEVRALKRALSASPQPDPDDRATIVRSSEPPEDCATDAVLEAVSRKPNVVTLVQVEVGTASLAWARSPSVANQPAAEMSFGDDYYPRRRVEKLLRTTAELPAGFKLDVLLGAADEALQARLPPAAQ